MMQVTQGNSEVWMHREQFWFIFLRTCICKLISYPHGKHAWTVREGAFVFEELEVHFADVVLQVKCCREVGLAVIPGTNQHRLMGSMDPFVAPQSIRFLEHLLTHLACKCSYDTFLKWKTKSDLKKIGIDFSNFVPWPQHIYLDVWPYASEVSPRCVQAPGSYHEGSGNLHEPNEGSECTKKKNQESSPLCSLLYPFEEPYTMHVICPERIFLDARKGYMQMQPQPLFFFPWRNITGRKMKGPLRRLK